MESEEKSGRKNQQRKNAPFVRSFVWVDVDVIGDASPTNLIRTDTSECARGGKNERSVFVRSFNEEVGSAVRED